MPLHTTLKLEANEEYPRCQLSNDNPNSAQFDVQWHSFQAFTKRHSECYSTSLGLPRKLGLQFEVPSTCTYFTRVVWVNLISLKIILLKSFLVHLEGMLRHGRPSKKQERSYAYYLGEGGTLHLLICLMSSPFHSWAYRCKICLA